MSDFVHLHVHTEYSLLDGLSKIKDLVAKVKEFKMNSIAITDHGVMYGAIEFYKECLAQEIKPIIGMEAYVSKNDHTIKEKNTEKYRDSNHLVLLAQDHAGYQNLMKLTSIAHLEGFYYKPRFDRKTLKEHSEGLICLSGCPLGELSEYLSLDQPDQAKKTIEWYLKTFGPKNYFLEIQRHQTDQFILPNQDDRIKEDLQTQANNEKKINLSLIKFSQEFGIPLVATNDVHYIEKNDASAQDALVCIQTGKDVADTNRMRYVDSPDFYLKSTQEMAELFLDLPDAITNTQIIADRCQIEIKLGEWYFPDFKIPQGLSAGEYLKKIAFEGAKTIFGQVSSEIEKRLNYELDVIEQRGYSPYFLIVGDMANWCREEGIVTTTRGSAAGSLVLFVTGITEVNPLKYQLPFERFLNPFRPSPPDIDLDIADNKRGHLIAYITQKYGADKVAQICTFGRMLARGSVRDIGRVLGYPYSFPDKIAKAIPLGSQGFPMTIKKALKQSQELKKMYQENSDARKILDLAMQIEGNARHLSVHAAAVVISPTVMTNLSPLQKEAGGEKIITQYEMHAAEEVGLIKFDILGIRNLAILNSAIDIVKATLNITIDHKRIPLDDQKTFDMLTRGETMGTFQLGGTGMTRYLMDLKPERIEDIMAMIALFRPGPMANIPEYIKRKNDPKRITYLHPKMKNYLEASYGILVYQEDIMFTALELAGYDWGTVDKLRKAIGKKIPEEMAKQEKIFIQGCQDHSQMNEQEARKIWDLFVPFQGYGFNKAHAAAYGIVAYQTAFMKANYPVEYMTAVLTAESDNTDKIVLAIEECKRMGIPVLPPDINTSRKDFTIVSHQNKKYHKAIRFGLNAIKNVGAAALESIITIRKQETKFNSLTHFCTSVDNRRVNKKVIESLIKVGAMDAFGNRHAMLEGLETVRQQAIRLSKTNPQNQTGLFDTLDQDLPTPQIQDQLPEIKEFAKAELLNFEKELLGLYLTDHPMADALKKIEGRVTHKLSDLDPQLHSGTSVTLGGILTAIRPILTKKNNSEMAFARLEDESGKIDVVIFPRIWSEIKNDLKEDYPFLITGNLDYRDETLNLMANKFTPISTSASLSDDTNNQADVCLTINRGTDKNTLQQIGQLLKANPGKQSIAVILPNGSANHKIIKLPYMVNFSSSLKTQIDKLINPTSSKP